MATLKHRSRRTVTLLVAGGLTLAGTGVAFAYWTAQGTGTGAATTGTVVAFAITSTTATGGPLSPGGPAQAVAFTVTNPGTGVQQLSDINVRIAENGGGVWNDKPGCSLADYTVAITVDPTDPAPVSINPGAAVTGTASIQMIDTGENQDACQSAEVPLWFETNQPV
jgi:hypothetical protein